MTIHCRVIACLPADTSRDFVTLTFDLLTLNSCYAWRVTLSTLQFEDPTPISSWFMSHNVSCWLPMKMRTRPLTIHCLVTAFLSADTSRDLVTLTFDLLTLSSCHIWRVTWPTLPRSLKTLRLFFHELRVITVPIDYRSKCVRGHCACAESRDPWVGGEKRLHFWNPRPRFAYSLYNFGGS